MKVILASQSPRRAALMDLAQIDYEVIPSSFDEKYDEKMDIEDISEKLAYGKALDVFNNTQGDRTIIGADTLVYKNGKVYGKPQNRTNAIKMLRELQGTTHQIYTSVAILIEYQGQYKELKKVVRTDITIVPMTDAEIIEYVDNDEPFDKAGGYAIQSCFCKFIERMEGNYMTAIGLPLDIIYKFLKENEVI